MTTYKDTDLREALRRKYSDTPQIPADFLQRMLRKKQKDKTTKYRRVWLSVAASVLLLLTLHLYYNNKVETEKTPVVAQQTEKQTSTVEVEKTEQTLAIAQESPVAKAALVPQRQPAKAKTVVRKASTVNSTTDSLDYYINKIERELAEVDESLYIERMQKVIHADERLQRIVNSYILHTLDKEGRPQTAHVREVNNE